MMRCSYSDDPALRGKVFDLLDVVFPGVRQVEQNARQLGGYWEAVSTPFIHFEGGAVVSHSGATLPWAQFTA
jgi:hypothetical protein